MTHLELPEATARVRKMEQCFDALQEAARDNPAGFLEDPLLQMQLKELVRYYESGLWLQDYEQDEKGLFPKKLKRGVLSQDAVFCFLDQIQYPDGSKTQFQNWGLNHAQSKTP